MKTREIALIILILFIGNLKFSANAEETENTINTNYRHSVDICPISPLFNIWALHYKYKLTEKDELITGFSYMNIQFNGVGESNSPALILGYRRYLWKNLHIEYEIWPAYDNFYEANENKYYPGFDLWNEFRLGYLFDFKVAKIPCFINVQWPFGFGLYASNKPDSFWDLNKENKYFYFPPLFFLGVKF